MRILLASFIADNGWSGMGKWSHRMAEGLTQLGHSPALWFADDFPRTKRCGRLSVLLFPLALALRLWRRRREFDAVVIHEPSGLWYGLLRCVVRSLPPMVLMCHNVESRHFGKLLNAARRGLAVVPRGMKIKTPLFRLWQTDGAIKLADHVVCLSADDLDYIVHQLGRAPERVTRQTNGVAADKFQSRRETATGQRVLFVGGWLDAKGRRTLPLIWSKVLTGIPHARLTVVGSGQRAEVVLGEFAESERASVTVVPHVSDESEMVEQYAAHDLFLMPSLSEGSPLSLLEAMASAMPVVAARVGGVPDIIKHGADGLLFDALTPSEGAARVCELLSDAEAARRLGRAGRERVRTLTWASAARTLSAAIESALLQTHPDFTASPQRPRDGEVKFGQAGTTEN